MPQQNELDMLSEESETLAEFLYMLQREHRQLHADFAAVLRAAGGAIRVPAAEIRAAPIAPHIERLEDPATGAVTFRLQEPAS